MSTPSLFTQTHTISCTVDKYFGNIIGKTTFRQWSSDSFTNVWVIFIHDCMSSLSLCDPWRWWEGWRWRWWWWSMSRTCLWSDETFKIMRRRWRRWWWWLELLLMVWYDLVVTPFTREFLPWCPRVGTKSIFHIICELTFVWGSIAAGEQSTAILRKEKTRFIDKHSIGEKRRSQGVILDVLCHLFVILPFSFICFATYPLIQAISVLLLILPHTIVKRSISIVIDTAAVHPVVQLNVCRMMIGAYKKIGERMCWFMIDWLTLTLSLLLL